MKVDVHNLIQGQTYFYSFSVGGAHSPIGRFKVPLAAENSVQELQYAIFSCSNWGWGFFNAFDAAARFDLDFWMHLGDAIYEYDEEHYPSMSEAVRTGLQPPHELITLADYRQRHALYRTDLGLQALSANAPMIAVWVCLTDRSCASGTIVWLCVVRAFVRACACVRGSVCVGGVVPTVLT